MASLTIRNLDDDIKSRLRVRAAQQGHSMEQEARVILDTALRPLPLGTDLATRLGQRAAAIHGVEPEELRIAERASLPEPPTFDP